MREAASLRTPQLLNRPSVGDVESCSLSLDRESRRHYADDRPRPAIRADRGPDHIAPAAEARLPELMAEHNDCVIAIQIFAGGERSPEERLSAERRKDVGGRQEPGELERLAVQQDVQTRGSDHAQVLEGTVSLAPFYEVGGGDNAPHLAAADVGFPDRHDAIGIAIRQWLQHHAANHAEDGGGGPDAQRQSDDGRDGEARRANERAGGETEVLDETANHDRQSMLKI